MGWWAPCKQKKKKIVLGFPTTRQQSMKHSPGENMLLLGPTTPFGLHYTFRILPFGSLYVSMPAGYGKGFILHTWHVKRKCKMYCLSWSGWRQKENRTCREKMYVIKPKRQRAKYTTEAVAQNREEWSVSVQTPKSNGTTEITMYRYSKSKCEWIDAHRNQDLLHSSTWWQSRRTTPMHGSSLTYLHG